MGFHVHLKLGCLLFSESEVKQCCFLWLICSACHCRFVQQLVRLTLVPLPFPTDSLEALLGPMTYPSAVQVSVDVHAVHPSGHTSV